MLTIAFDVNGTLTQERIRYLFWSLDRDKCRVIVWSTLGKEYCRQFCQKYGLNADEYWGKQEKKVEIALDDNPEDIYMADEVVRV